jgi:hypothetical protein
MVIIGLILVFILVAAQDSRRRAEEAATLALITKLETGLNDRLDALLQTRPDPNWAHFWISAVYTGSAPPVLPLPPSWPLAPAVGSSPPPNARAQVIAWYDFIKSELPDVFFVQTLTPGSQDYPINFAANPYPGTSSFPHGNFILPLGNTVDNNPPASFGAGNAFNTTGTGIYGASFFAAAALNKNLGYGPKGYDGVDNDSDGLIDEFGEGGNPTVLANLANHQHHTARAEMLYAILVEGVGPLGSVFNRDDFTDREVRDTDGDGLPEFVDAWGQPLQFFRWPMLYHSTTQRGQAIVVDPASGVPTLLPPYNTAFEAREQGVLDPNQQLMAPAWWSSAAGANTSSPFASTPSPTAAAITGLGGSGGVVAFEYFFHRLTEPLGHSGATQLYWDRGAAFPYRRAFQTRPLIVSSGPDRQIGVFLYPNGATLNASMLLMNENNAIGFVNDFTTNYTITQPATIPPDYISYDTNSLTSAALWQAAQDDISNQKLTATATTGGP